MLSKKLVPTTAKTPPASLQPTRYGPPRYGSPSDGHGNPTTDRPGTR